MSKIQQKEVLPEEVAIELNYDCNKDCYFCFNKVNAKKGKGLTKEKIFYVIDKINAWGVKAIRFTGGEPLLRSDLKDILKYAKSNGRYIILNTNGDLINRRSLGLFRYVDEVLVSIHSEKDLKNKANLIKNLKKYCHILRACTIATRPNINKLEKFYEKISKLSVDDWFLLRPIPNEKNRIPLDYRDIKELIEKMNSLNSVNKMKLRIQNALPFCSYYEEMVSDVCVGGKNDDGRTRLVIDTEGNIKPSYFMDKVLGTIFKNSLKECWSSEFLNSIRQNKLLPKKCISCYYVDKCNGGLRFAAYFDSKNLKAKDPLAIF